jgi:hypothetical protein
MTVTIARRELLAALGGAAAAWPLAARAQQSGRMRRIGVLMTRNAEDPEEQARLTAFLQGLQEWAGATATTCVSTFAGVEPIPTAAADMRPKWLRSRRMSFSPIPVRSWRRYSRRPKQCRSYSRELLTLSAPASL